MSFFNFLNQTDINRGIEEYRATEGAVLIDVRTPQEYKDGRIPGSKNVPLQNLEMIRNVCSTASTPLYIYCHSGARSSQATKLLQKMGYSKVINIGGIAAYKGKVEK